MIPATAVRAAAVSVPDAIAGIVVAIVFVAVVAVVVILLLK